MEAQELRNALDEVAREVRADSRLKGSEDPRSDFQAEKREQLRKVSVALRVRQQKTYLALEVEEILETLPAKVALAMSQHLEKVSVMRIDENKHMSVRMSNQGLDPNDHPRYLYGAATVVYDAIKATGREVFFEQDRTDNDGRGFAESFWVMKIKV